MLIAPLLVLVLHAGPSLKAAEQAESDLEFDKAQALYEKALAEPGTREERLRALQGLAMSLAIQGEVKASRAAFEKLLVLDPGATVDLSMGPKIAKPFDQAKRAVAGKHVSIVVERSPEGPVNAWLNEDVPLAATVRLYAREKGSERFSAQGAPAGKRVSVPMPADAAVEVYAEAIDAHDGVLYGEASASAPRAFPAVKTVTAVKVAVEDADRESRAVGTASSRALDTVEEEEEPTRWPIYVGVAVVVLGGTAAAFALAQPQKVNLPAADRTAQLPFR